MNVHVPPDEKPERRGEVVELEDFRAAPIIRDPRFEQQKAALALVAEPNPALVLDGLMALIPSGERDETATVPMSGWDLFDYYRSAAVAFGKNNPPVLSDRVGRELDGLPLPVKRWALEMASASACAFDVQEQAWLKQYPAGAMTLGKMRAIRKTILRLGSAAHHALDDYVFHRDGLHFTPSLARWLEERVRAGVDYWPATLRLGKAVLVGRGPAVFGRYDHGKDEPGTVASTLAYLHGLLPPVSADQAARRARFLPALVKRWSEEIETAKGASEEARQLMRNGRSNG